MFFSGFQIKVVVKICLKSLIFCGALTGKSLLTRPQFLGEDVLFGKGGA